MKVIALVVAGLIALVGFISAVVLVGVYLELRLPPDGVGVPRRRAGRLKYTDWTSGQPIERTWPDPADGGGWS